MSARKGEDKVAGVRRGRGGGGGGSGVDARRDSGWIFNSTQYKSVDHSLLQFLKTTINTERTCADAEKMTRLMDRFYLSGWDAVATLNRPSVRPSVRKALPHRADPGACSMFARLRGASCDPTWRRSARRRMSRKTCTDRRPRCPASRNQR